MPTYIVNQIYFGKYADLDPVEGSVQTENVINELETVSGWSAGTIFDDSAMQLLQITENDTVREVPGKGANPVEDAIRLEENDYAGFPADTITYDLDDGNGPVTSALDSVVAWNVTVTLGDNSTFVTPFIFMQLEDGSIFSHMDGEGMDGVLDNSKIQSIRLDSYFGGGGVGGTSFGGRVNWSIDNSAIVCFAAGTLIETVNGLRPVEDLAFGDLVLTLDDGYQPIRWIGCRTLDSIDLTMHPNLRPIRIRAGALGDDLPRRDLVVSPQHRVFIHSRIARNMFDSPEVLAASKQFVLCDGIDVADDLEGIEYWHFMFDKHQIVYSEGAATESLYAGPEALKAVGPEALKEIHALMPELAQLDASDSPVPARFLLSGRQARKLAERHVKKNRKLVEEN